MNLKSSLLLCAVIGACAFPVLDAKPVLAQANGAGSIAAANEVRFQNLEAEIRRLTAVAEEQANQIRALREELELFKGDAEVRFNDMAAGRGMAAPAQGEAAVDAPSPSQANPAEPPPTDALVKETKNSPSFQYEPPKTEGQLGTLNKSATDGSVKGASADTVTAEYEQAYSYIKSRSFDQAEASFASFLKAHPNHNLSGNAQYWYGETFYVRGKYDMAVRAFAEGYKKYPQGPKAPSNLLKLGMSLGALGKKEDACIAYKQLEKDYAKSSIPVLKRAQSEMQKIGCK